MASRLVDSVDQSKVFVWAAVNVDSKEVFKLQSLGLPWTHSTHGARNRVERWFRTLKERTGRFYNNLNAKRQGILCHPPAIPYLIPFPDMPHKSFSNRPLSLPTMEKTGVESFRKDHYILYELVTSISLAQTLSFIVRNKP